MRRDFINTRTAESQHSAMHTFRAVLPYLWSKAPNSARWRVAISLAGLILAKIIAVATPYLYKLAVDGLSGTQTSPSEWVMMLGISGLIIAYMVARFMRVVFNEVRNLIFIHVEQRALRMIGVQIITHIHNLSMRYHITRKTGALSRIIDRCIRGVESILQVIIFQLAPLIFELILITIVLTVAFDFWYAVVIFVMLILYAGYTSRITEWRVKIRKIMNAKDREATQGAIDGMLNFETVKYFDASQHEINQYNKAIGEYGDATVRSYRSMAVLNLGQAFIIQLAFGASLLLGAYDVSQGNMTVGDFVMIHAYMMQIVMPLDFLGFVYNRLRQSLVDMGDAFDLLNQVPEITDHKNAHNLVVSDGKVVFENVDFSYTEDRLILRNISLQVNGGQMVAIVGASGSGKSTIGRLLFRFYDIKNGKISIDGQDISTVTQSSLHQSIGVIPQDTVLFNNTIYYNLSYGNPDATYQQIVTIAKQARIHDFIISLKDGYDTIVGERGLKLSGGEKQRVGIARTLLKNPKILLLDEATSALDTTTEYEIQHNLRSVSKGRSVIAIAHRLSTIMDADNIIVLDNGQIIEQGNHEQLLDKNGTYAHMWYQQLRENDT